MKWIIGATAVAMVAASAVPAAAKWWKTTITLEPIGVVKDIDGAEISAYDAKSKKLYVVDPGDPADEDDPVPGKINVIDLSDPSNPTLLDAETIVIDNGAPNSVAVHRGVLAIAVAAVPDATLPGVLDLHDLKRGRSVSCTVGALPDMVTFTPNGAYALVANEGEPNDAYTVDPEGSVSIINVRIALKHGCRWAVRTADFTRFNGHAPDGVRVFGPNATVAQDLEPEYITVSKNSRDAWVVLQENNAIAKIDVRKARIKWLKSLGVKDHMVSFNKLDASNRDDAINIRNWPVVGMYQPDAIASYSIWGRTYLVTANEGDARDYDGFSEEERVKDLVLDPTAYPDAATLQLDENLGRLNSTTATGDTDGDGDIDQIHAYGARSFTIWSDKGELIYDSGDDIARIQEAELPEFFNANDGDPGEKDARSDDKGAEPEGVVVGKVNGRSYAFVALERAAGGVMVFDVSNPRKPEYVEYEPGFGASSGSTGPAEDIAPEGVVFISKHESPTRTPLLVLSNEESATVRIYAIKSVKK